MIILWIIFLPPWTPAGRAITSYWSVCSFIMVAYEKNYLKNIPKNNHYRTICGPIRSECYSRRVLDVSNKTPWNLLENIFAEKRCYSKLGGRFIGTWYLSAVRTRLLQLFSAGIPPLESFPKNKWLHRNHRLQQWLDLRQKRICFYYSNEGWYILKIDYQRTRKIQIIYLLSNIRIW